MGKVPEIADIYVTSAPAGGPDRRRRVGRDHLQRDGSGDTGCREQPAAHLREGGEEMKTKNLAVAALVGLLVLALGYNFLVKPSNAQAKKVKAETATERTKLQPLQAQLAQANIDSAHAGTFKAHLGDAQERGSRLARARELHS